MKRLSFLVVLIMSTSAIFAQGLSPLEESDKIFGVGRDGRKAPRQAASSVRVAHINYPLVFLFHPLMTRLKYNMFSGVLPYFSEGEKLRLPTREVRRQRRDQRRRLLDERARVKRHLDNLLGRLNRAMKTGGGKKDVERFWAQKKTLQAKLRDLDSKILALDRIAKDPLERVKSAKRRALRKIESEVRKVVAWMAKRRKIDVVFNASGQPLLSKLEPERKAMQRTPQWNQGSAPMENPFEVFLKARLPRESRGPSPRGLALLSAWHEDGPKVLARMPDIGQQSIVFGGTDLTWPVLEILLRKHKFPKSKIAIVKAYVTRISEVSHARW